jgi:hypothetical protein
LMERFHQLISGLFCVAIVCSLHVVIGVWSSFSRLFL